MIRPCFLIVDREHSASISTRKLVVETAKFNVITAYSAHEAIETLHVFPAVSGVIMDAVLDDMSAAELIGTLKATRSTLPVVVVGPPGDAFPPNADHIVESFQPAALLELLRSLQPEASRTIEKREEHLEQKEKPDSSNRA